jgi:hypothetical protein
MLASLIGRWKVCWRGTPTLRAMETTGRAPKRNRVCVSKKEGDVYVVGDSFCVREHSILKHPDPGPAPRRLLALGGATLRSESGPGSLD